MSRSLIVILFSMLLFSCSNESSDNTNVRNDRDLNSTVLDDEGRTDDNQRTIDGVLIDGRGDDSSSID